jgi:hypothetical protein
MSRFEEFCEIVLSQPKTPASTPETQKKEEQPKRIEEFTKGIGIVHSNDLIGLAIIASKILTMS